MAFRKRKSKKLGKIQGVYEVGDLVLLNKKRQGIIRYVGQLLNKNGVWYGIELTDKNEGENNGNLGKHQYFECQVKGKGIFVKPKHLIQILPKLHDSDEIEGGGQSNVNINSMFMMLQKVSNSKSVSLEKDVLRLNKRLEIYKDAEIEAKRMKILQDLNNLKPIELMEKLSQYMLNTDMNVDKIQMLQKMINCQLQ